MWRILSHHTLGPLSPIEHCLNAADYLSIVADHVRVYEDCSHQDNAPCHKTQAILVSVLSWPPQSPDLNLTEHLLDAHQEIHFIDVQPTNLL